MTNPGEGALLAFAGRRIREFEAPLRRVTPRSFLAEAFSEPTFPVEVA